MTMTHTRRNRHSDGNRTHARTYTHIHFCFEHLSEIIDNGETSARWRCGGAARCPRVFLFKTLVSLSCIIGNWLITVVSGTRGTGYRMPITAASQLTPVSDDKLKRRSCSELCILSFSSKGFSFGFGFSFDCVWSFCCCSSLYEPMSGPCLETTRFVKF